MLKMKVEVMQFLCLFCLKTFFTIHCIIYLQEEEKVDNIIDEIPTETQLFIEE